MKKKGRNYEFVSEKDLVREFLMYEIEGCDCGCIWVKNCVENLKDLEVWEFEEVRYVFYRKSYSYKDKVGVLVWEDWEEERKKEGKNLFDSKDDVW